MKDVEILLGCTENDTKFHMEVRFDFLSFKECEVNSSLPLLSGPL